MSEQDNDSLERFIKKAIRKPEIEFREEDWLKLEARLDADPATSTAPSTSRLKKVIVSLAIIAFLATTIYLVTKVGQTPSSAIQLSTIKIILMDNTKTLKDSANILKDSVEKKSVNTEISKSMVTSLYALPNTKSTTKQASTYPILSPIDNSEAPLPTQLLKSNNAKHLDSNNNATSDATFINTNISYPIENKNQVQQTETLAENESIAKPLTEATRNEFQKIELLAVAEDSIEHLTINDSTARKLSKANEEKDSVVQKENLIARWSFVLSFAPDFSSTDLHQYTSPGETFGLAAHYHITNRFSVSTGILSSHKKYVGNGNEYKPPTNYWKKFTNGIIPEKMYGSCNIIEIPLALQYTAIKTDKNRMLVTTGISSYLMINESYQFNFNDPNPGAATSWTSKQSSEFLFNTASIAISYERNLKPNVAVGIEPYIKIPLTGIGWTSLKFYSVGASITLRYRHLKIQRTITHNKMK
jgi:hypothetical protein